MNLENVQVQIKIQSDLTLQMRFIHLTYME
jgi:hypothetical protein